MAISIDCDDCGRRYRVSDDKAGRRFRCGDCGSTITVPSPDSEWDDEWDAEDGFEANASVPPRRAGKRNSEKRASKSTGSDNLSSRTMWPAIFLYIFGTLSLVNHAMAPVLAIVKPDLIQPGFVADPAEKPEVATARKIGYMVGGGLFTLVDLLVLIGAWNLHKTRSYPLAMAGSIAAVIPCLSPCVILGIPFGVWALVLLNDQTVKSAFR